MRNLLLILSVSGCDGDKDSASSPSLTFLSPAGGETVTTDTVDVSIVVEDFALVEPEDASARLPAARILPLALMSVGTAWAHEGTETLEGFCRLTLDGAEVADMVGTQHDLSGLTDGEHTLEGELLYPDADPLDPPVNASVKFMVAHGGVALSWPPVRERCFPAPDALWLVDAPR